MERSEDRARFNKQTRGQGRTQEFPRLLGERLCLDFVNTIEDPLSEEPVDYLPGYADLVRWNWHAAALAEDDADRLLNAAEGHPDEAVRVYTRALALRASCNDAFRAVARSEAPREHDLEVIQAEYVAALTHTRLHPAGGGFEWMWPAETLDLSRVLWPTVRSAVDLLTCADLRRLKVCPGAGDCGWLFYDTSRNGMRRWCSMEGCGSRVKMRRHYANRQQPAHGTSRDRDSTRTSH